MTNNLNVAFRGIGYAQCSDNEKTNNQYNLSNISDLYKGKNESSTTKALFDAAEDITYQVGDDCTYLKAGSHNKSDTFGSEYGEALLESKGTLSQCELFKTLSQEKGGIEYAHQYTDYAKSAKNFAKADIKLIEEALGETTGTIVKGNLDYKDVISVSKINDSDEARAVIDSLDINEATEYGFFGGETSINPEEYASYMLLADGLTKDDSGYSFDENKLDGLITSDEAQTITDMPADNLKSMASEIYKKYY